MKGFRTWLGTEEALAELDRWEAMYAGQPPEKVALHDDDLPSRDKNFNVYSDRKGLYLLERIGNIAVVKVHGSLTNTHRWWHEYLAGQVTSYEALADALQIAAEEEGINEILMDFATGGGVVRGLDVMSEVIRRIDARKPVFAHSDSHAFSAGYWLACTARRVTASRMAEVGSIGTLMVLSTYVKAAEKEGIEYHVFRAGEFKALGLPYETLDDKAKAYIQDNLEKTNKFFLEHVSRNRNLMMSERDRWAEGKTFFAEEALAVGLVDRVTTLADLIGSAASTTTTSDPRRFEMNISAEKLAQIAAGADPKTVLTAEELKQYEASLENPEPEANEGNGEGGEPEAEEPEKPAPEASADTMALMKEIGRLEAKLEAAEADNTTLQQALAGRDAQMASLLTVAQVAVGNLQGALQRPKEARSTAAEVVAQFNELQGEMAKRFKIGQQTTTPVEDSTKATSSASFRH
ncbi:MAG: S49 family peptidase [Gammaproteobacteria bacterium]|nr:S49 family peptidase [Alphaproteobacteria bacterium]MBU1805199.1 S49 family peptidase [Gammaproteobacteria bacterium]